MDINRLLNHICHSHNLPVELKHIIIIHLTRINIIDKLEKIIGPEYVDKFCGKLQKYHAVISGSFCLAQLLNLPTETNDIDIFIERFDNNDTSSHCQPIENFVQKIIDIKNDSGQDNLSLLKESNKNIKSLKKFKIYPHFYLINLSNRYVGLKDLERQRTFKIGQQKINIVTLKHGTKPKNYCLQNFDIKCCSVVFDGVTVEVVNLEETLNHRTEYVEPDFCPTEFGMMHHLYSLSNPPYSRTRSPINNMIRNISWGAYKYPVQFKCYQLFKTLLGKNRYQHKMALIKLINDATLSDNGDKDMIKFFSDYILYANQLTIKLDIEDTEFSEEIFWKVYREIRKYQRINKYHKRGFKISFQ